MNNRPDQINRFPDRPPADARMPVFAVDLVRAAALRDPLSAARIEEDR